MMGLKRGHGARGLGAEEPSDRQVRPLRVEQLLGLHDLVAAGTGVQRGRDERPAREPGEGRVESCQRFRLRAFPWPWI
jgi:hypothetical protein